MMMHELFEASMGRKSQFTLILDIGSLRVNDVVRRLPERRVVMHGELNGREVFVKAFLGGSAERYAQRDLDGVRLFQQASILTPHLIHQERSTRYMANIHVFDAVQDAQNSNEFFQHSPAGVRVHLLRQLSACLAKHHQAGLLQSDMHPKNFLVQSVSDGILLYSLDGDGVGQKRYLTLEQCLHNLATLLCKFDVLEVLAALPACLDDYARERAMAPFSEQQQQMFIALMRRLRLQMLKQYADSKVFRQCGDVDVVHKPPYHMYLSSAFVLDQSRILKTLQAAFVKPDYLKQGNTCTIVRYQLPNLPIVLKRYNIKHLWHALSRALRRPRAAISWANAHRLMLLGIATPAPVALIIQRQYGFNQQAYYLAEYIAGHSLRDIHQHLSAPKQLSLAADALAQLFYRMHLIGIAHGDCKADNFKYHDGRWWVLDLDSMRQHNSASVAMQAHIRDLKRLFANWKADDTLYNVMFSAFAKRYGDDPVWQLSGLP